MMEVISMRTKKQALPDDQIEQPRESCTLHSCVCHEAHHIMEHALIGPCQPLTQICRTPPCSEEQRCKNCVPAPAMRPMAGCLRSQNKREDPEELRF
jgi:hypothetical protein